MLPGEIKNKKVLISPLNWGMGHVSRCIPLIHSLNKNGNEVLIAADEFQTEILKQYFPTNDFIYHKGYPFKFSANGNFFWDLLRSFFGLKKRLNVELSEVEKLVTKHNIDFVFSDHRYGFRSENCHSILLTHQINLPIRWFEFFAQKIHKNFMVKFDEVWVPDSKNNELAGKLSLAIDKLKIEYIGALSRFQLYPFVEEKNGTTIIVSGPDIFALAFLKEQISRQDFVKNETTIICSENVRSKIDLSDWKVISSHNWKTADKTILHSKRIISRSGYSTLMDLSVLRSEFEISPTPGQREQEYLFHRWNKKSFSSP